jgi:hypothetical protein
MNTNFAVLDQTSSSRSPERYTQNIDYVERLLPDLDAKTICIYSRVDQARYGICNWVYNYKPYLF